MLRQILSPKRCKLICYSSPLNRRPRHLATTLRRVTPFVPSGNRQTRPEPRVGGTLVKRFPALGAFRRNTEVPQRLNCESRLAIIPIAIRERISACGTIGFSSIETAGARPHTAFSCAPSISSVRLERKREAGQLGSRQCAHECRGVGFRDLALHGFMALCSAPARKNPQLRYREHRPKGLQRTAEKVFDALT
jgi:hypothetical protein